MASTEKADTSTKVDVEEKKEVEKSSSDGIDKSLFCCILYENDDWTGEQIGIMGSYSGTSKLKFKSIKIETVSKTGGWLAYDGPNFTGNVDILPRGKLNKFEFIKDNGIVSIRHIAEMERFDVELAHLPTVSKDTAPTAREPVWPENPGRIFLFAETNFGGGVPIILRQSVPDARSLAFMGTTFSFDNIVKSVIVGRGTWNLCADLNFSGHRQTVSRTNTSAPTRYATLDSEFNSNGITSVQLSSN